MSEKNRFHLSTGAAETYDEQKVPGYFGPMAEASLDLIDLPSSAHVLDVACGTGAVARAVAARLPRPSLIIGVDLNPAMIEVARQRAPVGIHSFDWHTAPADALPRHSGTLDLVFCQHGLQFFADKPAALAEMRRVLRPGGHLHLACPASVPSFFEVVADVLRRFLGEGAAMTAVRPFIWNEAGVVLRLITDAGFEVASPRKLTVMRRISATHAAIRADILATPNEPVLRAAGESTIDTIVAEIFRDTAHFIDGDSLAVPQEAYLFNGVAS